MTEGKILDMLQTLERDPATTTRDASPVQMDLNENRSTRRIPLPSPPESRQKRVSSLGWPSTSIVRNPLGIVFAGAEMLMQLDPASAQPKRLTANISRAARRMRELLPDLAAVTYGRNPTPEICQIRDVITDATEAALPAAETQSVQISHDVPDGIAILLGCSRILRVFFSLITNALEAMPHGRATHIGARKKEKLVADRCRAHRARNSGWDSGAFVRGVRHRRQGRRPGTRASALPPDCTRSRRRHVDWTRVRRPPCVIRLPLTRVSVAASSGTFLPIGKREKGDRRLGPVWIEGRVQK